MVSVFLSHSREDKFFARKLAEKLQENGVQVWIDEAELRVGDSLIQKISEAVKRTDYVAIVLARMRVPKMVKNGFNSVLQTSAGSRRLVATRNSGTNAKSKTVPKS